jgi:hypothetical protein
VYTWWLSGECSNSSPSSPSSSSSRWASLILLRSESVMRGEEIGGDGIGGEGVEGDRECYVLAVICVCAVLCV